MYGLLPLACMMHAGALDAKRTIMNFGRLSGLAVMFSLDLKRLARENVQKTSQFHGTAPFNDIAIGFNGQKHSIWAA